MAKNPKNVSIHITFRNTEGTDPLKTYANEKVTNCLQKFVHHDTDAHVVLSVEKNRQIAEISFHADGQDFQGKEETEDLYASIDAVVHSITRQLRKHKEKITSHH
ncbi:MAG: ribosome-associated translation inhibitor RaiA [Bdellovibrionales bacterium]|nr:ribosome-associated translation inhibitor RaiA [Bdellovibrionales bacterium]